MNPNYFSPNSRGTPRPEFYRSPISPRNFTPLPLPPHHQDFYNRYQCHSQAASSYSWSPSPSSSFNNSPQYRTPNYYQNSSNRFPGSGGRYRTPNSGSSGGSSRGFKRTSAQVDRFTYHRPTHSSLQF